MLLYCDVVPDRLGFYAVTEWAVTMTSELQAPPQYPELSDVLKVKAEGISAPSLLSAG